MRIAFQENSDEVVSLATLGVRLVMAEKKAFLDALTAVLVHLNAKTVIYTAFLTRLLFRLFHYIKRVSAPLLPGPSTRR